MSFKGVNNKRLFLFLIMALAILFRFYGLGSLPPGLYPDEAINGNQAVDQPGKLFYPENNGREGLFINLLFLSTKLLGVSVLSLRVVSAFFGVLTVLAIYLLGKEMFNSFTGLTSALFLSVSFWHVNFSRIVFRAVLTPFFLTLTFYWALRAFKEEKLKSALWAGLLYGLGFHTYISYRFSVLILPFFLLSWFLVYKKKGRLKKFFVISGAWMLFTLVTALPIGLYFLKNTSHFFGRGGVSVFNQEQPLTKLGKSLILHLASFNVTGDFNWRHNIAGRPALFWPVGTFFLIGFSYSLYNSFQLFRKRETVLAAKYQLLVAGFFVMILPGVLTYEGIPHHLRIFGSIPFVFVMSGLGASLAKKIVANQLNNKRSRLVLQASTVLLALLITGAGFYRYFHLWGKNEKVKGAFSSDYVKVGRAVSDLTEDYKVFVVVNQGGVLVDGVPMPAQTPMFIERTRSREVKATYLRPEQAGVWRKEPGRTAILLLQSDPPLLSFQQSRIDYSRLAQKLGVYYIEINPP